MVDATNAFQDVVNASDAPIILLFTKYDLFRDCLEVQPFTDYFPDYSNLTDAHDYDSIALYLASHFLKLDQRNYGGTFIRFVNAADPDDFRAIFEEVKSKILNRLSGPSSLSIPQPTHDSLNVRRQTESPLETWNKNQRLLVNGRTHRPIIATSTTCL